MRYTGRLEFRTFLPGDGNPDAGAANLSDGLLTVRVLVSGLSSTGFMTASGSTLLALENNGKAPSACSSAG